MQPPEPTKLLRLYDKGHITVTELHRGLVQAAASHPPEDIAALLPAEQLQGIRDLAASPPTSPEGCPRFFQMGSPVGAFDREAHECEQRRLWYDGVWRWHRYFEGGPAERGAAADQPRE
jgi:hypothetical protein